MTTTLPADKKQLDAWFDKVARLPADQRDAMLRWAKSELQREKSLKLNPSPAYLARDVDPDYIITEAIDKISARVERTLQTRRGRLLITMPPQEGKTELVAVWTVIRQLQRNADTRIILACYSEELAEKASRKARNYIYAHGSNAIDPITKTPAEDKLGLTLAGQGSRA